MLRDKFTLLVAKSKSSSSRAITLSWESVVVMRNSMSTFQTITDLWKDNFSQIWLNQRSLSSGFAILSLTKERSLTFQLASTWRTNSRELKVATVILLKSTRDNQNTHLEWFCRPQAQTEWREQEIPQIEIEDPLSKWMIPHSELLSPPHLEERQSQAQIEDWASNHHTRALLQWEIPLLVQLARPKWVIRSLIS